MGKTAKKEKEKSLIFTKETLGVVVVLFSTLCLICLITRETLFSSIGIAVNSFFFGCFGFFAYAVCLYLIGLGVLLISGKKTSLSGKRKALITFDFIVLVAILHIITTNTNGLTFGEYIGSCYNMGGGGIATTSAGGFFMGLITYAICALLTNVGSYVILGIAFAIMTFALVKGWMKETPASEKKKKTKFRTSFTKDEELGVEVAGEKEYPVADVDFSVPNGKQKLFVNNPNDFALKTKREINKGQSNPIKLQFSDGGLGVVDYNTATTQEKQPIKPQADYKSKLDYIKTPTVIDMEKYSAVDYYGNVFAKQQTQTTVSGYVSPRQEISKQPFTDVEKKEIPFIEHDESSQKVDNNSVEARAQLFEDKYFNVADTETTEPPFVQEDYSSVVEDKVEIPFIDNTEESEPPRENRASRFDFNLFNTVEDKPVEEHIEEPSKEDFALNVDKFEEIETVTESNITSNRRIRDIFLNDEKEEVEESSATIGFTSRVVSDNNQGSRRSFIFDQAPQVQEEPVFEEPKKQDIPINREYFRPPFELLESYAQPINAAQENHEERKEIIKRTLAEFKIDAEPKDHIQGPSITRYEIMMPPGISVKNVLRYDDDLKMRLAAKNGVRIEAPIPGKNLVGIEVANNVKVTVGLKEVMEGLVDKKAKSGALMFALGKDIVGNAISDDLTKGPHYLIAGATGSGKSVCLHVMLVSLLMRYSPEELKLVLVDPKSVEFRKYEHLPHLLVDEIINEPKRALSLLHWAYEETNRRNDMFTACGGHISNIDDYNSMVANDKIPKLPRIVFVIDELADLMEACKKDLEARIRMIAAKSRSAGIHLVLATQRPSVDVITGTIKANLPSRIALKVMNFADSQTILGGAGAEKLLGNGDMLYKNSSMGDYERYQGAYISGREISNVVEYIKEKNVAYFDQDVQEFLDNETKPKVEESSSNSSTGDGEEKNSAEFMNALWFAVNTGTISISSLQRRFSIGYAKAGGFIDRMEQRGFISGYDGSKARKVLLSKEEYISRFGPKEESF
ncbi:MAG: DNA translocase FtsK [Clostridia bacterium]|nr:DNA translocase FtsK [Clostridia bacterium]